MTMCNLTGLGLNHIPVPFRPFSEAKGIFATIEQDVSAVPGMTFFGDLVREGALRFPCDMQSLLYQVVPVSAGEYTPYRVLTLARDMSSGIVASVLSDGYRFTDMEAAAFLVAAFEDRKRVSNFFSTNAKNYLFLDGAILCIFWQQDRRCWYIQRMSETNNVWHTGDLVFRPEGGQAVRHAS